MIEQQVNDAKDKLENVKVYYINIHLKKNVFLIDSIFFRKFFKMNLFHIQQSMHLIKHVMLKIV